jgi:D-glycero-D-manno-heptose 1,7-bisphosphate phosphatase
MNKALFLDRDGVIDDLVFHEDSGGYEAPRNAAEVRLRPGVREALQRAADDGWLIIVISNQPDSAKGKATRESIDAAHRRLIELLNGAPISAFYYCFHRAEDRCECRKPGTKHLLEAARKYDVDLRQSWFAGDVDTDIECGRRAGMRTALIEYEHSAEKRGNQRADLVCRDLDHVVRAVTAAKSDHGPQSQD